jgi:acyl-CoA thioesterase-1
MLLNKTCTYLTLVFLLLAACNSKTDKKTETGTIESSSDTTAEQDTQKIIFFGNSLTAGYGIDPADAFPALVQRRLDSLGYSYEVINAGLSGETTASGLNRIEWVLRQKPAVFILELGGNDGLRGIPLEETRKNLNAMISIIADKYPKTEVILAGMMIPPNMGQKYTDEFRLIFPEIASKREVAFIPFLLEGVAGEQDLNLPDMIHPNEKGHVKVAENVWAVLKELI